MATELPPAVARFIADVSQYTEPLQKAIEATKSFGDKTDSASLKAREMGLRTMEAADKAAAAMKIAEDAADKYARGEIDLAAAQKAAADAAKSQARADIELAALQDAVAAATKRNADEQENLSKKTEDASNKGFAEMGMLQKIWMIAGFATGSLEPLAAGLIAVTGGLASGITSAGLGLASFGLVAKSTLTAAGTATSAVQAAQVAYNSAIASGANKASSYVTEQEAIKTAYAQLSPAQVQLSKTLGTVENQWQTFVQSNTSGVSKIVSQGIGLLPSIFKDMQMFMKPTETALSHVIKLLGTDIKSAGFASFMKTMSANAGPSIEKIVKAILNIIGTFGHLMQTFAPFSQVVLSGLDKMTGAMDKWAGGLSKTKGFGEFMTMVKTNGPTILGIIKNLLVVAGYFVKDMSGSVSNTLWLKVIPQLSSFAAAFMKTHSGLVEFGMNMMLVGDVAKKSYGSLKTGYETVTTTTKNIKNLAAGFTDAAKAADKATGPWGTAGGKLKSAMTGVPFKNFIGGFKDADKAAEESSGKMGTFGGAVKKALSFPGGQLSNLKKGMNDADYAAEDASGMMGTLGGNITKMVEAVKGWAIWSKIAAAAQKVWTGIQWAFDAAMDAMPIIAIVAAIALLVAGIIYAYIHFKTFRDAVNDVGRVLKAVFIDTVKFVISHWKLLLEIVTGTEFIALITQHWAKIKHVVLSAVDDVVNFVKSHWMLIVGFLLGPIALAAALVYKYWAQIKHAVLTAVDDIISFVKSHWQLILSIIGGPIVAVTLFIIDHWHQIEGIFSRGVSAVISFLERLPGEIIRMFANAGSWLLNAGKAIIDGLIHGIENMAGNAVHAVESVGSDIKSGFMSAIHALSPSKDFADIGEMITAGLALGINSSGQQAVNESRMLAKLVTAAAMDGGITAAQASSLRKSLSTALVTALKGGVQDALATGTTGQIGNATLKMLQTIWTAARGQDIDTSQASAMAVWVKADNARLQSLAVKRNAIAKEIAAAQAFATSTASAAESSYDLNSASAIPAAPSTTPTMQSVSSIISTLGGDVSAIRKFSANIRKLAKEGLNKNYISQLIAMGPSSGGALAQEMANANLGQIKSINAAETQITAASNALGDNSAEIMYNTGVQAGKGFLSGLKAQQSAVEKVMAQIAAAMVAKLRKDLGIASPSRVMMEHGMMVAEGLAQGMEAGVSRVTQASARLSKAVTVGSASVRNQSSVLGGGTQTITINLRNEITGKMNEKEVWSALQQQTFRYNIRNTGVVTGAVRPGALWRFHL